MMDVDRPLSAAQALPKRAICTMLLLGAICSGAFGRPWQGNAAVNGGQLHCLRKAGCGVVATKWRSFDEFSLV